MKNSIPHGMSRRHFLSHLALGGSVALGAGNFLNQLQARASEVQKNQKACIFIWLNGGAPTIDMWDLKPQSRNGGEFKPISTKGDLQISDQLPEIAKIMDKLSVVRSMSTREADHGRGNYFMHTAFVPNPTVVHPSFGSVVSYEVGTKRKNLQLPAFVSIGGGGMNPGFLGMTHAPFVVDRRGQIRNAAPEGMDPQRLNQRLQLLSTIENNFIRSGRGEAGQAHREVYEKAVQLMTSEQMKAFNTDDESPATKEMYGTNDFGNMLIMARRLVQTGVPFIEVQFPGGWDLHQNVFNVLKDQNLPRLDKGISGLVKDLDQRGMLNDTTIICMGEFGRTPRINQDVGRDHWAHCWSVLVGGGGLQGGRAIGETDAEGTGLLSDPYLPGDLWATVAHSLKIPLDVVHQTKNGRPMKIVDGGRPIQGLIS